MNFQDGEGGHTPDDLTEFPNNLAGAVTVPLDTNLEALWRAFQKLTERHPMLRTRFSSKHGEVVQREYASIEIAFQPEDASRWNADQLDQHLEEEIYRSFDLEQGPTWRVVVFKQAPVSKDSETNEYTRDLPVDYFGISETTDWPFSSAHILKKRASRFSILE